MTRTFGTARPQRFKLQLSRDRVIRHATL
jgi:hypothetical protein